MATIDEMQTPGNILAEGENCTIYRMRYDMEEMNDTCQKYLIVPKPPGPSAERGGPSAERGGPRAGEQYYLTIDENGGLDGYDERFRMRTETLDNEADVSVEDWRKWVLRFPEIVPFVSGLDDCIKIDCSGPGGVRLVKPRTKLQAACLGDGLLYDGTTQYIQYEGQTVTINYDEWDALLNAPIAASAKKAIAQILVDNLAKLEPCERLSSFVALFCAADSDRELSAEFKKRLEASMKTHDKVYDRLSSLITLFRATDVRPTTPLSPEFKQRLESVINGWTHTSKQAAFEYLASV